MASGVPTWPNGKRIAVAVTTMFETWSEGKGPSYSTQTTALKPGTPDYSAITWSQYGGNVGVWRIIRLLDRLQIPATFFTNARCAEIYPEAVAQIGRSGHDIAGHGYTQDQLLVYLTPDEEHAAIKRSLDLLGDKTGKRPEGWLSPVLAWTPHTTEFLAEEKVLWQGEANYTDLPRRVVTPKGTIAHIPHSDFTDNRVLRTSPRIFYDVYKDTFDYLYVHEPMGLLVMVLHCHWGGRPLMAAMFDKLIKYFAAFPDVWFARHGELAHWAIDGKIDDFSYAQRFFAS